MQNLTRKIVAYAIVFFALSFSEKKKPMESVFTNELYLKKIPHILHIS